MKKTIVTLLLLTPLILFSQTKRFGFTTGVNIGNWTGDTELFSSALAMGMNESDFSGFNFESAARAGLSMSFFMKIPVVGSLLIQPGLAYQQRGIKFTGNGDYIYNDDSYQVSTDMIYQMDYIDLALLLKYPIGSANVKPYLLAGPGAGYLISSKLNVSVSVEGESDNQSEDLEIDQKMDVNLNVGGGLSFSNGIQLEVRYSKGFKSLLGDAATADETFKNTGICISLGVCF